MPDTSVTFRTGNYSTYKTQFIDGSSVPVAGCLYFLKDTTTGRNRIFLDGVEYESINKAAEVTIDTDSAITVTKAVGNYAVGDTIPANTNLETLLRNMLEQDIYPVKVNPVLTVSSTYAGKSYEVGTNISVPWTVSMTAGSYTVEGQSSQNAGCTITSGEVSLLSGSTSGTAVQTQSVSAGSSDSGAFTSLQLTDGSKYYVKGTIQHSAGSVPVTFLGRQYPSEQIAAGSLSKTTSAISSYRAYFYGWANNVSTDYSALTGTQIRSLDLAGTTKRSTPITSITTNRMQEMYFAAPHSAGYTSVSVVNANTGLPQTVTKYASVVSVVGNNDYTAIDYDVWYIKNAAAEAGSSTFTVTWA